MQSGRQSYEVSVLTAVNPQELLNQGDLSERRTWAWVLTAGRVALSDPRVHRVGTGCLWLTLCRNQNESVKDRTLFLPLLIFPDIEDECRRASLQLPFHSDKEESSEYGLGKCTYLSSHCRIFGMDFSQKWIWLRVGWSFPVWLLRGGFPMKSFHMGELNPATNHKTSPRSWAFKMPCCFGEGSNVSSVVTFSL